MVSNQSVLRKDNYTLSNQFFVMTISESTNEYVADPQSIGQSTFKRKARMQSGRMRNNSLLSLQEKAIFTRGKSFLSI